MRLSVSWLCYWRVYYSGSVCCGMLREALQVLRFAPGVVRDYFVVLKVKRDGIDDSTAMLLQLLQQLIVILPRSFFASCRYIYGKGCLTVALLYMAKVVSGCLTVALLYICTFCSCHDDILYFVFFEFLAVCSAVVLYFEMPRAVA